MTLRKEAAQYFKEEPGFHRLLSLLIKRYYSLGRIGGSVRLERMTEREKNELSRFFNKNYRRQDQVSITMEQFEKALQATRFAEVDLYELLTEYNGAPLRTKAEVKASQQEQRARFFTGLFRAWKHPQAARLLEAILQKQEGTRRLHRCYDDNPTELRANLKTAMRALQQLPLAKPMRLPLFAASVTGNPHAFDKKFSSGKIFLDLLHLLADGKGGKNDSEALTELLFSFGLLRDDLLNNVSCTGLMAFHRESGQPILSWQAAFHEKRVQILPLRDLVQPLSIRPASTANLVFVVENSGVFSALLDEFADAPHDPPMVCVNGQCKLASLLLIDALAQSGATVYYSGDFDPEGLSIADRLVQRHPQHVVLWRMGREEYQRCRSDKTVDSRRLKQLERLQSPSLAEAKAALAQSKRAGYQEQLLPLLKRDILQHFYDHQRSQGEDKYANLG
ncbi:TIGR02679 family protein [Tumebacillus avium]|uniref:TIGR02679 family protein n=1 Tax=Tumebacillus avium TaxID=1903704 RepID=A0A1Y0ILZ1_9BACL|nr:TIGR02679 family protein [Tumebacillus avium]ARU61517.1 TIGR02679 family protein [Tumebacillus avium]